MEPQNKLCARKATWLAFGLIALAASISSAQDTTPQGSYSETTHVSALEAQQTVFLTRVQFSSFRLSLPMRPLRACFPRRHWTLRQL